MNKYKFKFLVVLMSLSLIGIILVQLYWINTSYINNDNQFKLHVTQIIGKVADQIKDRERYDYDKKFNEFINKTGKIPGKKDIKEIFYFEKDKQTNREIVYSNTISFEDYNLKGSFFDSKKESISLRNYTSKRRTEIYHGDKQSFDDAFDTESSRSFRSESVPDEIIEKEGEIDEINRITYNMLFNDMVASYPIEKRITNDQLKEILTEQFLENGINTHFEYGIYSNGLSTTIKSSNFVYDENKTYSVPILQDLENNTKYQLYISFPEKSKYLFSDLLPFVLISLLFTFVIIAAYISAINQLIKQRQISEIKTDFINNMTHEFKTPIATINLALDAIKNPKIIDDNEKVMRYLQMIRDENKRMHAQIENILRISKLEKRELDIQKEKTEINELVEIALDHVMLIIEDREGEARLHLNAVRDTALVSPMHFTNVLVNILDNAIKYSIQAPQIDIYTENVKDFILIRIQDQGAGMSKVAQKRIFEKFYREHTGDLHNVKGHGLGLAYVKQIIDDHNAHIYVESEKGKGSTFVIKLPLIN
ncbi:HAMP domain-containing sensor histidine kinase [Myroides ceti]|uniref:histidine kinase n=1 Tax=Paenimyroides ceti TaxID=395087 RepID=A0ABT8CVB2_9FLAO|nr:HAMP domain-containing sensor histidine kinase [Paenimyroides ceti]MDN3707502.1 HAMP domain-containing sensor histidine kinase [Paenimyroides ceti]